MKLLHIDSGILGNASVSRGLTADLVARLKAENPGLSVTYRDLVAEPVQHLTGTYLSAQSIDASQHSPALQQDLATSAKVLEEFLAADIVVIGAPMYNFSIPSQLKAWIDRIAVAGKTFRYTDKGAEGLAGGKKVIIASSRGGIYSAGSPIAALDHQETYLRTVFGFFGIADVEIIRAEGVNLGTEAREKAVAGARRDIAERTIALPRAA